MDELRRAHRVPDLEPDPYLSTSYQPQWAHADLSRRELFTTYPREDLQWLDRQWDLAATRPAPPSRMAAWWKRFKAGESALWPILLVVVGFTCLFGALILFAPGGGS